MSFSLKKISSDEKLRCGFDIGSGTTKLQVGVVDLEAGAIRETLESKKFRIEIKEASKKSGVIPEEIEKEVGDVLKQQSAKVFKVYGCSCIATATEAFRSAVNGQEIAKRIEKKSGVRIDFLTQDEEALLGQKALIAEGIIRKEQMPKIVTWENGNGSAQIVVTDADGKPQFWHHRIGKIFAKDCKREVVEEAAKVAETDIAAIEALIQKQLGDVPSFFIDKLKEKGVQIIGLGAMFTSVHLGLKKEFFTKEDVQNLIDDFISGKVVVDKKDFLSDVIFVHAFMKHANIEKIWYPILKGEGSTSGLLLDEDRWAFSLKRKKRGL